MSRSALLALAVASAAVASAVSAATIEVKVMQNDAAPSTCTLRRAIQNANANNQANIGCSQGSGADVITFDIDTANVVLTLDQALPAITEDLTIRGRDARQTRISGDGALRPLVVNPGVTLVLERVTLALGEAGIEDGGALLGLAGSTLILRDCRITGSAAANGGAVAVTDGTLRIERCLIDANDAAEQGGGVWVDGSDAELVNTTVSGNVAADGGGLAVVAGSAVSLRNATLARNEAGAGGNAFVTADAALDAGHTLFAQPVAGGNCSGAVASVGWNLADDANCALADATDRNATSAGLVALAENGGPTPTHRLQAGSAAIDGGATRCRDAQGVQLATDQRGPGFLRRADGDGQPGFQCDIGAFEVVPEPRTAASAAAAGLALAALARRRRLRVP